MNWKTKAILQTVGLLALAVILGACAQSQALSAENNDAAKIELAATNNQVDYSCTTDADCEVKDIGNCCGYYPACVNKDSPTFPEQVKAECAKEDRASICGFQEITSCSCVEQQCRGNSQSSAIPLE